MNDNVKRMLYGLSATRKTTVFQVIEAIKLVLGLGGKGEDLGSNTIEVLTDSLTHSMNLGRVTFQGLCGLFFQKLKKSC